MTVLKTAQTRMSGYLEQAMYQPLWEAVHIRDRSEFVSDFELNQIICALAI